MSVSFDYKIRPTAHLMRAGNALCGRNGIGFKDVVKVRNHPKPCANCLDLYCTPSMQEADEIRVLVAELREYIEYMPHLNKHRLRLEGIQNKMEKILNK